MRTRIAFIALLLLCGVGTANAQDESLKIAREYFDKAQTLFEAGSYEKAAEYFEKAFDARKYPQFLFNIGVCYEKTQKWQQAIDYYNRYLAELPEATDKTAMRGRIEVLKREVKRIEDAKNAAPPPDPNNPPDPNATPPDPLKPSEEVTNLGEVKVRGLIVIESEPQGATIYIDSKKKKPLGKTPWSGSLSGEHKVFIESKGYKPRETSIYPSEGKLGVYWFGLKEEDYLGWLEIKSNVPGADIYIDDKAAGVYKKTPSSGNIKPGKHKIWVTKDGYNEFYTEIEIVRGQTHEVTAQLKGAPVGYLNIRGAGVEFTRIKVDGKLFCQRGPCRKPLPEGSHTVEFEREDHKPYKRTVVIQRKTETSVSARLASKPGRGDAITAYVLTAGFLGLGIYAGLEAKSLKEDIEAQIAAGNPPLDSGDDRFGWKPFTGGKFWAVTADAAFGLAFAAGVSAIYYTFRDKGPPSTGESEIKTLALEPTFGPDYGGVTFGGRF